MGVWVQMIPICPGQSEGSGYVPACPWCWEAQSELGAVVKEGPAWWRGRADGCSGSSCPDAVPRRGELVAIGRGDTRIHVQECLLTEPKGAGELLAGLPVNELITVRM